MSQPPFPHRLPPASGETAKRLVVFLHGVGSSGDDLEPLARLWQAALPDAAMAFPDGPVPFDLAPQGRQWFSVNGVTPANRPQRVAEAVPAFDRVLNEELAWAGVGPEALILVGFSQGSIMSLDAVLTGRWQPLAVVAYAGRLSGRPAADGAATGTRVLLIHGTADPVIPVEEMQTAAQALVQAGIPAETRVEPGVGHTITPSGAQAGAAFLRAIAG
ncbi:alpha/beta hydrolase [Azospirillum soli]|uniref:alpha/beta hydrolase n=1 Tax=Azospirillum soli TaxID=1304799 RepID=UPI001AE416FC|nr:prolyl oligopeptidase family serine peptidase [Azospirillum soli]MBP2314910.1 phospholipase/carboxylesterase [Azospirillum soli]